MAWPPIPPSSDWLVKLSMLLRREIDAAPNGIIRIDISKLAALWACTYDEAERTLCEAAFSAQLAVGVVDGRFCDIMTVEEARTVLKEHYSQCPEDLLR